MKEVQKNVTNLKTKEKIVTDYNIYYLSFKDLFENGIKFFGISCLAVFAFYKNIFMILMCIPVSLIYPFFIKNKLIEKRKNKLLYEFKDFLRTLKSFLDASYSVENGFSLSINEMSMLHGKDSLFVNELIEMCKKIKMNVPIEMIFKKFAQKTHVDEIIDFSEVLIIAKKNGGNVNKVIKNTMQIINDKIEIDTEIKTLTAEKQFEQSIMNILPFIIIIYMNITSSDFLSPLYKTFLGNIIMSVFLIVYILAIRISKKILDIEM